MKNTAHYRTIKLVQHTPMWHFQSKQKGCCLRASEVKPKLDRFLAEINHKEYTPLDYKMHFSVQSEPIELNETFTNKNGREMSNFPLFFGNMNNPDKKHLVYHNDKDHLIEMHLFSLDTSLLDSIVKVLPAFFACHSFGTRQDKGFGCFYPKANSDNENFKKFDNSGASYMFTTTPSKDGSPTGVFKQLFKFIETFHKMIRSGVNYPKRTYCKSFMFFYADSKKGEKGEKVHWDKPVIRHHFCLKHPRYESRCGHPVTGRDSVPVQESMRKMYRELEALSKNNDGKNNRENNRWLFRDALGLASSQEWKDYNDTLNIAGESKDANGKITSIKRFQSPILYRPVPNGDGSFTVYIYLKPIPETYRNADFTVTDNPGRACLHRKPGQPLTGMKIYKDFKLDEYFEFIINFCNHPGVKIEGENNNDYYIKGLFINKQRDGKLNFRKVIHK